MYTAATDEHDEDGVVISDVFTNPKIRTKIFEKRMRKMRYLLKELPPPSLEGPAKADLTLVGYGSSYQLMVEAMEALKAEGLSVNVFCLRVLWPFQTEEVTKILSGCSMMLAVENSYAGQITRLIRMETGIQVPHFLRKFDGEPFEPTQVIDYARTLLKTKPTAPTVKTVMSDEGLPDDFSPIGQPPTGAEVQRVR